MASPRLEVLFFYNANTGAPLTGLTPSFATYKDDTGTNISQPSISEIGGGAYKFTPVFADPDRTICYVVDAGSSAQPRYYSRQMRPEDWATDEIPAIGEIVERIRVLKEGRWKIFTTGPDANRLVLYDTDGVTAIQKWDLKDASGMASVLTVFERDPLISYP